MRILILAGKELSQRSRQLTAELLNSDWHSPGDGLFFPGTGDSDFCQHHSRVLKLQVFLKNLTDLLQGSGITNVSYRILHDQILRCLDFLNNPAGSPPVQAKFMEKVKERASWLLDESASGDNPFYFHLLDALAYIRSFCARAFSSGGSLPGFLASLLQHEGRAGMDIVSLNPSEVFEQFLSQHAVSFHDGFEADGAGGANFSPQALQLFFRGIRLIKLAGSVDWFWEKQEGETSPKLARRPANLSCGTRPVVLWGDLKQILEPPQDVLLPLYGIARGAFSMHFRIITVGYDWNDLVVNRWLIEWLAWREANRMVIIGGPDLKSVEVSLELKYGLQRARSRDQLLTLQQNSQDLAVSDMANFLK